MSPKPTRTAFDRAQARARLTDERFDVLVIGGGITGAGVALDAAARGLRTALVERDDFASGTSGCATCSRRSTSSSTRTWPNASGC
jgi:glycine/D-amino acid oxidase-like deaminating enzyme